MYSLPIELVITDAQGGELTYYFDVADITLIELHEDTRNDIWWVDLYILGQAVSEPFKKLEGARDRIKAYRVAKYQGAVQNVQRFTGISADTIQSGRRTDLSMDSSDAGYGVSQELSNDPIGSFDVSTVNDGGTTQ